MEINAVMPANVPPLAEVEQEDGGETGNFADRLKEADEGNKPEKVSVLKQDDQTLPNEEEEKAGAKNGVKRILQADCIPVCIQSGGEDNSKTVPAPEDRVDTLPQQNVLVFTDEKEVRENGRETDLKTYAQGKDLGVQAQGTEQALVLENAPDEAEGFAQKAMCEIKEQIASASVQTEDAQKNTEQSPTGQMPVNRREKGGGTAAGEDSAPAPEAQPDERKPAQGVLAAMEEEPTGGSASDTMAEPEETQKTFSENDRAAPPQGLNTQESAAVTQELELAAGVAELPENTEQPVTRENMFSEIISRVTAAAEEGKSELYVQLKPEHLGGLSISLSMGEEGLTAKITTSEQSVQSMLHGGMSGLQETLREKGIQVALIEVICDTGPGMADGNASGGRREGATRSDFRIAAVDAKNEDTASFYYDLSSYEVLAEQGGSVEFSA